MSNLEERLLSVAVIAVIIGLFVAVFATRNREGPYSPVGAFTGCYSNGTDRLLLLTNGRLVVNGTAVGSYHVLKPVGGTHGYLVEAVGLTLAGGRGTAVRAMPGSGGFLWPVSSGAIEITFAPDVALTLKKMGSTSC